MQLNEGEADCLASKEEADMLLQWVEPKPSEGDEPEISAQDRLNKSFEKNQENQFLNFKQFQGFLQDLQLDEQVEKIDKAFYAHYFRRGNCCKRLLFKCCGRNMRPLRMKQMHKQLKRFEDLDKSQSVAKQLANKSDVFSILLSFVTVFGGISQLFDFYMDIIVLWIIYKAGMDPDNARFLVDYQIALFICFVSIASTIMATQSCIIGMKFSQGDFEPHNFKKQSCIAIIFNYLILTFAGALLIVPLEILDNLQKIMKLPAIIVAGPAGVQKVDQCFFHMKHRLTKLTVY